MSNLSQSKIHQDYFHMSAPVAAVRRAIGQLPAYTAGGNLLLTLLPDEARPSISVDGRSVPVVPFPVAVGGFVALALDNEVYKSDERLRLLLPRSPFDRVADHHGVDRITSLSFMPGAARADVVFSHLGACLGEALQSKAPADRTTIKQLSFALALHVAQRYGGLQASRPRRCGGLAPWQLRLARDTFDRHLDASISLDALAAECGLSVSHFSRAFSRSTGMAPHKWLMQRRVDAAKQMMLRDTTPLAQIALACGFADQPHFTRTFAALTGLTPGRWRIRERRDGILGPANDLAVPDRCPRKRYESQARLSAASCAQGHGERRSSQVR